MSLGEPGSAIAKWLGGSCCLVPIATPPMRWGAVGKLLTLKAPKRVVLTTISFPRLTDLDLWVGSPLAISLSLNHAKSNRAAGTCRRVKQGAGGFSARRRR